MNEGLLEIRKKLLDLEHRAEQLSERNQILSAMIEEAFKMSLLYLNVPESRALQERWNKLKNAP